MGTFAYTNFVGQLFRSNLRRVARVLSVVCHAQRVLESCVFACPNVPDRRHGEAAPTFIEPLKFARCHDRRSSARQVYRCTTTESPRAEDGGWWHRGQSLTNRRQSVARGSQNPAHWKQIVARCRHNLPFCRQIAARGSQNAAFCSQIVARCRHNAAFVSPITMFSHPNR